MIDAKLLASAIERMEAEIALFPESEFTVEHEQTRAIVAAAKVYEPMRNALSNLVDKITAAEPHLIHACLIAGLHNARYKGPGWVDELEAARAALNHTGTP